MKAIGLCSCKCDDCYSKPPAVPTHCGIASNGCHK